MTTDTSKETKQQNSLIRFFLTGFAMGSADIVPGVSGGTIAFIAGIYEKLISSIKLLSQDVLKLFIQGKFKKAWSLIPFSFLIPLAAGLFTAIFTLAKFLEFALHDYPVFVWSFFFGLVVASVMVVRKKIKTWNPQYYATVAIAAIAAYIVVGAVPVETPATPLAFFLAGSIAITAMILPGISGSFMLLIMGKYTQILQAVTNLDILTLGVFMGGAAIGLAVFAHILSWLFKHHHDIMIAILTGLMIGSLRKIWPWKEVVETFTDRHGEVIPLVEKNIAPMMNGEFALALLLAALGFTLITFIERYTTEL